MTTLDVKPRIVFEASRASPLGRFILAGLLRHHTGVPEKPIRTLGDAPEAAFTYSKTSAAPERPMRTLGHYALVYLLNGTGDFTDARGTRLKLVPGDMWVVFPDIPHWYGPGSGAFWDEFFIIFSSPLFDVWRARGLLDPARPLRHLEPLDYWLRRLEELVLADSGALQQICALQHLLAEALEVSDDSRSPHWLAKACSLLQSGHQSPQQVARSLGMSYATFRRLFSAAAGVPPGRFQAMKAVDKASTLIITEELSNKEIAERLHFCDEFHFSRRFKQIIGLTPSQLRLKKPRTV
jgi:AraC-like DNA-binding protein